MADDATRSRKAEEMLARLRLREEQRKAKAKGANSDEEGGARKKADEFLAAWRSRQEAVEKRIQELEQHCSTRGDDTAQSIKARAEELDALDAEVTQAGSLLTIYHSTQLSAVIKALRQRLAACQSAAQPRGRFTFAQAEALPAKPQAEAAAQPPGPPLPAGVNPALAALLARPTEPVNTDRELKCLAGRRVVKGPSELRGQHFVLEGLTGCDVFLLGDLAALRAYDMTDCRLFAAAVQASAYVEGLKGCTLVLATGQLRVHDTHDSDFYLRMRSDPILEGCDRLRFAPLGPAPPPPRMQSALAAAGLAGETGQWRCIKDFEHPALEQSPNWEVIPEAERKPLELPEELLQ